MYPYIRLSYDLNQKIVTQHYEELSMTSQELYLLYGGVGEAAFSNLLNRWNRQNLAVPSASNNLLHVYIKGTLL